MEEELIEMYLAGVLSRSSGAAQLAHFGPNLMQFSKRAPNSISVPSDSTTLFLAQTWVRRLWFLSMKIVRLKQVLQA